MRDTLQMAAFARIDFEDLIRTARVATGRKDSEVLGVIHRVIDATATTTVTPNAALGVFRMCLIDGDALGEAGDRAARWARDPVAAHLTREEWIACDRLQHPRLDYAVRELGHELERATGIRAALERLTAFLARLIERLHHRRDPR